MNNVVIVRSKRDIAPKTPGRVPYVWAGQWRRVYPVRLVRNTLSANAGHEGRCLSPAAAHLSNETVF